MAENSDVRRETGDVPAYDAQRIETKWQARWEEESLYKTDENPSKPKRYVPVPLGRPAHGPRAQLHHR